MENQSVNIELNNPSTWPKIDDNLRCFLINNGVDQSKDSDFFKSAGDEGRKFTINWFTKKINNGETLDRKKIYGFPCMLFSKYD